MIAQEFDYIVVGGGTAGCVVAAGLIDRTDATVALIEAGSASRGSRVHTPALYPTLWGSTRDWSYATAPQPALRSRKLAWPRGRGMGGSSAINAMIYSLGHPQDAAAYPSGYDLEAARERLAATIPDEWTTPPTLHPASERFLAACKAAGLADELATGLTDDSADDSADATSTQRCTGGARGFLRTAKAGRRHDAFSHFLRPKLGNRRLRVFSELTIRRILFRGDRGSGVEAAVGDGGVQTLAARHGVILCGGAIASPALLLRSGIGPREQLQSLGVDAVAINEHVGRHLQDHLVVPLVYAADNVDSLPPIEDRDSRIRYVRSRTGPLASNLAEAGLFASLDRDHRRLVMPEAAERPQLQVHFTPTHYLQYPLARRWTAANTLAVTWLHPASRGEIRLDPDSDEILIEPNYLSAPEDGPNLAAAVEAVDAFAEAFHPPGGWRERLVPRPKDGRREWPQTAIESFAVSIYHPVGTCRMAATAGEGVVDSDFRVFGVEGLYIADAAVMPDLPTGNPQGTVMANAAAAAMAIADLP